MLREMSQMTDKAAGACPPCPGPSSAGHKRESLTAQEERITRLDAAGAPTHRPPRNCSSARAPLNTTSARYFGTRRGLPGHSSSKRLVTRPGPECVRPCQARPDVPGTAGGGRGAALDTSPVLKFREQQETAPPRHPDQDKSRSG